MKLFKKLASLVTAATLALSFCAFSTACKDDTTVDAYVFILKNADGSAAQNAKINLCIPSEDGSGACYNRVDFDENGKCVYTEAPEAAVYEIHVFVNNKAVEHDGPQLTEAEYGEYTLVLK